ncbi:MAG TPA: carboxypeptidase regulatory-like domain-containing protein, partial [Vicinamibacterales bacterium]
MKALPCSLVAGLMLAAAGQPLVAATDLTGHSLFAGAPVPGATVTATRDDRRLTTTSDGDGAFHFTALDDGVWTIRVELRGFVPTSLDITIPPVGPALVVTLTMQSYAEMVTSGAASPPPPELPSTAPAVSAEPPPPDAADILNGSMNNGAASPFAQSPAFGNGRPPGRPLYTGGLTAVVGNSALNATPYSFVSGGPPAPSYGNVQLGATLGGPLKIPWLVTRGPNMVVTVQHTVTDTVTTQVADLPTAAERAGDFSALGVPVLNPLTGLPFPGNVIPGNQISSEALALLARYPLPEASGTGANYQVPVVSASTLDSFQVSMSQTVRARNTLTGTLAWQRTTMDTNNLFNFEDANRQSSLNGTMTWIRRLTRQSQVRFNYQVMRSATTETPFFANRENVSGEAGITGNNQDPANWGPPTLVFPDIASLSDAEYQQSTTQKQALGAEASVKLGLHNVTFGGDDRWNDVDVASQPNPRGTLTFTGAETGVPLADFLLGLPTTSAIAFGTTDTRLRDITTDLYVTDDWRLRPGLTVNVGVRWEYEAPFTEVAGNLVNLDVAPGFSAVSPVLASNPVGSLTGTTYPSSLIRPDKRGIEPRLGTSWRPWLGSSVVLKASYGLYRNLGVYQSLALLLAQQPPLAKTYSVETSPETPLTLANPFPSSLPTSATNTFAVDPNFREGGLQTWLVSAQRDLPASLTVIAAYLGAEGSHLMQAFLPNTYPA